MSKYTAVSIVVGSVMISYVILQFFTLKMYELQLYAAQMGLIDVEQLSEDIDGTDDSDDSTPFSGAFN